MALQFGSQAWPKMRDRITWLNSSYFNPIWDIIDRRLHALEELKTSWQDAVDDVIAFGLVRIDAVLGPAFSRIEEATTGGFLVASSSTSLTLADDAEVIFVIEEGTERDYFVPSKFVTITREDNPDDWAVAETLIPYSKTTGELKVKITATNLSSGPHDDWIITSGPGVLAIAISALDASEQAALDAAQVASDKVATLAAKEIAEDAAVSAAASAAEAATFDPDDYYDKTESDDRYFTKTNSDDRYYTKSQVDAKQSRVRVYQTAVVAPTATLTFASVDLSGYSKLEVVVRGASADVISSGNLLTLQVSDNGGSNVRGSLAIGASDSAIGTTHGACDISVSNAANSLLSSRYVEASGTITHKIVLGSNTQAINWFRFLWSAGNIDAGTFEVWGIK